MKTLPALILTALMAASCASSRTYTCNDGTRIRLSAASEKLIHVEAVPAGASFSRDQSLAVLPQKRVRLSSRRDGDIVTLKTKALTILLDTSDGTVTYERPDGSVIASEDRREFSPVEVEGTSGWTVRQVFKANPDEGFYGLGQHQADEWDYKGRNEELYQYNTKISVPFIVSSRGYGILWDSYSLCRWGDPREYAQLGEVFGLYDKDGAEGALTGTYTAADGSVLTRREASISQEYLRTPECDKVIGAPEDFKFNHSHVVFEGELEARESGIHRFYLYYAGYTRVFLDGKQVMPEIWRTAWNPNGRKFEAELESGKRVPVRIEWEPDGGTSYCGLRVLSPVDPAEQEKMSWWSEMNSQLDYWFVAGDSADEVIHGYRSLTGKAPLMPKWAMGYWQSRERYKTQADILTALKEFRSRNIPVDNIVQDWQYWLDDQWGSHEFDPERYPDPKGMIDTIHALGAHYMISVWPKFYTNTEHFKEFDSQGWMYQTPVRDSVEDWLGHQQSFYDAYSKGARQLFWTQMEEHLYGLGVDAWWMDASEPNIHDCTDMNYRKAMCGPTALGPSTKYFNAYALMNAEAIYDGQRSTGDGKRVFLLTRNGFAGLQRYSTASWSGDIGTRWEDMKAQISAGLNYSVSGIPFWTQDVGGFSVENRYSAAQKVFDKTGEENEDLKEWRELQTRWHEWGVFNPIYRAHGQWPAREPWNIAPEGHPAYEAITAAIRLRYTLMPYIYTMAARVHFDDYTIMRPLMMDFASDAKARGVSDEYMFGDAILVCPVTEYGARSREVYLPEGAWYDFSSGRCLQGGTSIVADAPYERIPLYVKAGQILPTGSAVSSTGERQDDIILTVYSGADASLRLYDDNGLDYSYEKGDFCWIPVMWDERSRTLEIGKLEGKWSGMPEKRVFTVNVISPSGKTEPRTITYSGEHISILL